MEATTAQPPQAPENDATRSPQDTFRFSTWVHVGDGAEDCEQRTTGACQDPQHFHAWCRLPNQLQHQDIRERALAAKARRRRRLRDPDSDLHEILEGDLDELRRDPNARELMLEELVAREWWKRQLEAMADVEEVEKYAHIDRDRERMTELRALPDDKRAADELADLETHLTAYGEAVNARREELEKPLRESLEGLDDDELIDQLREHRVSEDTSAAFRDTYTKWQWFAGTYTTPDPVSRRRRFEHVEALVDSDPEVMEALRVAYADMETALHRGTRGN